jgi:hypothetical protein
VGGERVDEVVVEAAALEAAGGVRRQEPFDARFAAIGLAAERQLAVDDGAAQGALGVVVGRLDALWAANVHSAGQSLSRFLARPRVYL